jgi:hypothetical protein
MLLSSAFISPAFFGIAWFFVGPFRQFSFTLGGKYVAEFSSSDFQVVTHADERAIFKTFLW